MYDNAGTTMLRRGGGTRRERASSQHPASSLLLRSRSPFLVVAWLVLVLLGSEYRCSSAQIPGVSDARDSLTISGYMDSGDFQACYDALNDADANNDRRVVADEYVDYAKAMSPDGLLDGVTSYEQLPVAYKAAFLGTACLCLDPVFGGNSDDATCCFGDNAHIAIPATPPSDDMSLQEKLYLYAACAYTTSAAEAVMNPTPAPSPRPATPAPTAAPTTATPTTGKPTTATPTTAAPTPAPTTAGQTTAAPATPQPTTAEPATAPPTAAATTTIPPATTTPAPSSAAPGEEATPSPTPQAPPTDAPVAGPVTVTAQVNYDILVSGGKNRTDDELFVEGYVTELRRAMNQLAEEVVAEVFNGTSSRTTRRRRLKGRSGGEGIAHRFLRRLAVEFQWPTRVGTLEEIECPEGGGPNDLCQVVPALVDLNLVNESNPEQVVKDYEAALSQAIEDGRLQSLLDPNSPVTVLTSSTTFPPVDKEVPTTGTALTPGATAGIVVGALALVFIPLGYLAFRQKSRQPEEQKNEYEPFEKDREELAGEGEVSGANGKADDDADPSVAQQSMDDHEVYTDAATGGASNVGATFAPAAAAAMLGASKADYGSRTSRKAVEAMEAGEDIVAEPEMDVAPDSSSNAGSSGWSSSAGISSLNTGSIDDSMDAAAAAGATLAAIGASSTLAKKLEEGKPSSGKSALSGAGSSEGASGDVTRSQLDALIEAGDWAAVGATAALLAAASDSQSQTSKSQASAKSSRSYADSMDAARAAELDNLVDAGDWEGVVLAAAKFEAAESSVAESRSTQESLGTGTNGSGSGTGTRSGTGEPSVATSLSDDPSKAQRRAELRAEVEALVRRVVPEEIDNVDEMMTQFKGREEELVETLRTMQERSVAQKARTAGQKAAKIDARRSVQRGVVPGVAGEEGDTGPSIAAAAALGAVVGASVAATGSSQEDTPVVPIVPDKAVDVSAEISEASTGGRGESTLPDSVADRRTALELAIEAGDWEAVGEAAAMMSDASVTTASTGEIGRLGDQSAASSSVSSRKKPPLEGAEAERAAELDQMIEKGDWTGVVEATKRFKESDTKRSAPSKEEQEALAQAEKWMKIAEQKKAEGAEDAGASDAAEWAIQRSLSQMKQAEKQQQQEQQGKTGDSEEDEV